MVTRRRVVVRGECGAGAVLAVALSGVLALVALTATGLVQVVVAHRTAQGAADLAALAGARASQDGGSPCAAAGEIATRNGATLDDCQVDGWEVSLRVVVDTGLLPAGRFALPARARAGPVSSLAPG